MSEPIVNDSQHTFNYEPGSFPTIASAKCADGKSRLYVAYQASGTTQVTVEMFRDNSGQGGSQTFSSGDGYRYPLLTAINDELYLVFMGDESSFNVTRLRRNANGAITDWLSDKRTSTVFASPAQMSVAFPTSTGTVMLWRDGGIVRIASIYPLSTLQPQTKKGHNKKKKASPKKPGKKKKSAR
jgi:hypothetical protein